MVDIHSFLHAQPKWSFHFIHKKANSLAHIYAGKIFILFFDMLDDILVMARNDTNNSHDMLVIAFLYEKCLTLNSFNPMCKICLCVSLLFFIQNRYSNVSII